MMASLRKKKRPNKRSSSDPMAPRPKFYKNFLFILSMFLILGAFILLGISSKSSLGHPAAVNAVYTVEVVNEFPHDPNAFTQGLLYAGNGSLFESTGLYGRSSVRKVDIQTGKVEAIQEMDSRYFGEGLTLLGDRLLQVTWLTQTGFKYDPNDFSKSEKFTHQMKDGWGLATDGEVLFGSDGTSMLYKIDPQTLKVIDKNVVKYKDHEVHNLNELEFIRGEIWANVYQTDCIARISQDDGRVLGWILLPTLSDIFGMVPCMEGLLAAGNHAIDVLNGIAWDSKTNRIFVTGKLWPKLYEIKLRPIKKRFKDGAIQQLCLRKTFFR